MEIMEEKSNEDMLIFNRFRIKMRSNLFRIKVTEILSTKVDLAKT